ncbi:MAG: metallophosphoesterase family protein, partial [Deltaproteobacteria bacterium]
MFKRAFITVVMAVWLALLWVPAALAAVVVYGDSRTDQAAHRKVVEGILKVSPAAVFHTGDFVNDGRRPADWVEPVKIIDLLRARAEFFAALGNHEEESPLFFKYFPSPGRRWYSVDREGTHFIVLDSCAPLKAGTEQFAWLKKDLAESRGKQPSTAVLFHHPLFSSGPHREDEMGLRKDLVPLFREYGVDIVIAGHEHHYERLTDGSIYYIVTAGGGAPLYDVRKSEPR